MAGKGFGGEVVGFFLAVTFCITCPEYGEWFLSFLFIFYESNRCGSWAEFHEKYCCVSFIQCRMVWAFFLCSTQKHWTFKMDQFNELILNDRGTWKLNEHWTMNVYLLKNCACLHTWSALSKKTVLYLLWDSNTHTVLRSGLSLEEGLLH